MTSAAISLAPAKRGEALIDSHTPLHAIVGFAAGVMGIDPHVAMITFIGARIVEAALKSGPKHAFFEREEGQSLGNEMVDLLIEIAGLHLGETVRDHVTKKKALGNEVIGAPLGALREWPARYTQANNRFPTSTGGLGHRSLHGQTRAIRTG